MIQPPLLLLRQVTLHRLLYILRECSGLCIRCILVCVEYVGLISVAGSKHRVQLCLLRRPA
jgi:hypothetical protein